MKKIKFGSLVLTPILLIVMALGPVSALAGPPKAAVCHFQEGNDAWKLLMLPDKAANAHLANHPEDGVPLDGKFTEECTLNVCDGTVVDGLEGCWYLGDRSESCTTTCVAEGLAYSELTRTVAGSDGTDGACISVLTALGAPSAPFQSGNLGLPTGCFYGAPPNFFSLKWLRHARDATTADGTGRDYFRVCACE